MGAVKAYYNEFDAKAAAWLKELVARGLIAPGDVDDRSITLVQPGDLDGYTQCHFFAGVGVWSHALRRAGWPDDRPVWTGSCPCQPFSSAGRREGFGDDRHLWPQFFRLIKECRPLVVFGEQVASKDGLAWLDVVHDDMEAEGYAVGAVDIPACGFGAPHKRSRLYFVADAEKGRIVPGGGSGERLAGGRRNAAEGEGWEGEKGEVVRHDAGNGGDGRSCVVDVSCGLGQARGHRDRDAEEGGFEARREGERPDATSRPSAAVGLADAGCNEQGMRRGVDVEETCRQGASREDERAAVSCGERGPRLLADAEVGGIRRRGVLGQREGDREVQGQAAEQRHDGGSAPDRLVDSEGQGLPLGHGEGAPTASQRDAGSERDGQHGPCNGFWSDAVWLPCRDGKVRPTQPGIFPLVDGSVSRVVRGGDNGTPVDADATPEARVMRLRGYGNAIVSPAAAEFIKAYMEEK